MTKNIKGFTLIELMIVLAISGFVTMATYLVFSMNSKAVTNQMRVARVQQNLRASLFLVEKEIKTIGYNLKRLSGADAPKITYAGISRICFQADLNENGHSFNVDSNYTGLGTRFDYITKTDDPYEIVELGLRPSSGTGGDADENGIADSFPSLLYKTALNENGNPYYLPIAENIEALNFAYLDSLGNPLTDAAGSPAVLPITDQALLSRIRKIRLSVIARSETLRNNYDNNTAYTAPDGTVILDLSAAADTHGGKDFERRMITRTFDCRNLGLLPENAPAL